MNLLSLVPPGGRTVRAGMIGAGEFGRTFVAQCRLAPGMDAPALCDIDAGRAVQAYRDAGYEADRIAVCDSAAAAKAALEAGKVVVVQDGTLLAELPIDIVLEATGEPDVAARNALAAIAGGKHVLMATKEADSVIGPLLARKAAAAGLVYTPADGDQPSLLIGLVAWAKMLGLEIVTAGKATEYDFVWNPEAGTVTSRGIAMPAKGFAEIWQSRGDLADTFAQRAAMLSAVPRSTVPDLTEMVLVANAIGLPPDCPELHAPIARAVELPDAFQPRARGGLLARTGVIDVFSCLRRHDEMSFAGGVFVTAACPDTGVGRLLKGKGLPVSADDRTVMLHNPVHLLGLEAPMSLFSAVLWGKSTAGDDVRPRYDVVMRATRPLKAGTLLDIADRHAHAVDGVEPMVSPARPAVSGNPLPYYMAVYRRLTRDVATGALVMHDDVEAPADSLLWQLRAEQDRTFL